MIYWFDFFVDAFQRIVQWLSSFSVIGINLWSFILSVIVLDMIISLLLNVVRRQRRKRDE